MDDMLGWLGTEVAFSSSHLMDPSCYEFGKVHEKVNFASSLELVVLRYGGGVPCLLEFLLDHFWPFSRRRVVIDVWSDLGK